MVRLSKDEMTMLRSLSRGPEWRVQTFHPFFDEDDLLAIDYRYPDWGVGEQKLERYAKTQARLVKRRLAQSINDDWEFDGVEIPERGFSAFEYKTLRADLPKPQKCGRARRI